MRQPVAEAAGNKALFRGLAWAESRDFAFLSLFWEENYADARVRSHVWAA
jgi:hypothetical protein